MNHISRATSPILIAVIPALLIAIVTSLCANAFAEEITVAAAADLTFAFKHVATDFQDQTDIVARLSFGSSGNFFSQIQSGAPYDMFFSADIDYAKKLESAGLIEPGSLYQYAIGKIVLWVPMKSKIDVARGLPVLTDPAVNKIAIANPEHAPYGRAAVEAMKHAAVYDQVKDKMVLGENVSQAAQFVQSGNADIGIIALSIALAPSVKRKGRYFEIPSADYAAIQQAAVILKSSHRKELARRFMAFLQTPQTIAVMERYGFAIPRNQVPSAGVTPR